MIGFRYSVNSGDWITFGGDSFYFLNIMISTSGPFLIKEKLPLVSVVSLDVGGTFLDVNTGSGQQNDLPRRNLGLNDHINIELVDLSSDTFLPKVIDDPSPASDELRNYILPLSKDRILSLEVTVNDEAPIIAGGVDIEGLGCALTTVRNNPSRAHMGTTTFVVGGLPIKAVSGDEGLLWVNRHFTIGDKIQIRILDSAVAAADLPIE